MNYVNNQIYESSKKTIFSNSGEEEELKLDNFKKVMKNNKQWAQRCRQEDPDYFLRLVNVQMPKYLWIGCSDSRVPANQIMGLKPGEVFVHRNIANIASPSDINCLAVIQFAVEHLKVQDIIVAGHYGCGGVKAAFMQNDFGPLQCWLSHIRQLRCKYRDSLFGNQEHKEHTLVQLNVKQQVVNVSRNSAVQQAWARNQNLHIHGVVYNLQDGILRDLGLTTCRLEHVPLQYRIAKKQKHPKQPKQHQKEHKEQRQRKQHGSNRENSPTKKSQHIQKTHIAQKPHPVQKTHNSHKLINRKISQFQHIKQWQQKQNECAIKQVDKINQDIKDHVFKKQKQKSRKQQGRYKDKGEDVQNQNYKWNQQNQRQKQKQKLNIFVQLFGENSLQHIR